MSYFCRYTGFKMPKVLRIWWTLRWCWRCWIFSLLFWCIRIHLLSFNYSRFTYFSNNYRHTSIVWFITEIDGEIRYFKGCPGDYNFIHFSDTCQKHLLNGVSTLDKNVLKSNKLHVYELWLIGRCFLLWMQCSIRWW